MKIFKKTVSILLIFVLLISIFTLVPTASAYAGTENKENNRTASVQDNAEITGKNDFGSILSASVNESDKNKDTNNIDTSNNISNVSISGTNATVRYISEQPCKIIVGIYDEKGQVMLCSGMNNAPKSARKSTKKIVSNKNETGNKADSEEVTENKADLSTVSIKINTKTIPKYYVIKAFMINAENKPISSSYEDYHNTQEYIKSYNRTTDDFKNEDVYNLDNDKSTNFAVFDDTKVKKVTVSNQSNVLKGPENNIYTFTKANNTVKNLKNGDIFYYKKTSNEYDIIKVKSVKKSGDTVTIEKCADKDNTPKLDDVFSYVKINTVADKKKFDSDKNNVEIDKNSGVTLKDDNKLQSSGASLNKKKSGTEDKGFDATLSKGFDFYKTYEDKGLTVDFDCDTSLEISFHVFIDTKWIFEKVTEIDFSVSNTIKMNFNLEVEKGYESKQEDLAVKIAKFNIPTTIPSVCVGMQFSLKFSFTGHVNIDGITISSVKGFKMSCNDLFPKWEDTSQPTTFTYGGAPEIGAALSLGVVLEPDVDACFGLLEMSIPIEFGVELKGEITGNKYVGKQSHLCLSCADLTLDLYGEVGIELGIPYVNVGIKYTLIRAEVEIGKAHASSEVGFGLGKCPNEGHKVKIYVRDKNNKLIIQNPSISIDDATHRKGTIVASKEGRGYYCYLANKTYKFTVKRNGYNYYSIDLTIKKDGYEYYNKKTNKNVKIHGNEINLDLVPLVPKVKYVYSKNTLYIQGTGSMDVLQDKDTKSFPWYNNPRFSSKDVKKVVIGNGINKISGFAFDNMSEIQKVEISKTVKTIGYGAFYRCGTFNVKFDGTINQWIDLLVKNYIVRRIDGNNDLSILSSRAGATTLAKATVTCSNNVKYKYTTYDKYKHKFKAIINSKKSSAKASNVSKITNNAKRTSTSNKNITISTVGSSPLSVLKIANFSVLRRNKNTILSTGSSGTPYYQNTITKYGMKPNSDCLLMILKTSNDKYTVDAKSLLYITQGVVDKDGSVKLNYYIDNKSSCVALVFGTPNFTTISIPSTKIKVVKGQTVNINCSVENQIGDIQFNSKNANIATVDTKGNIIGKNVGTTVITITNNGVSKEVSVNVVATSIKLNKPSTTIYVNGTVKVPVNVVNPIGKTTYTTSNKSYATVDGNGNVKGVKAGKVKVTVNNNGISKVFEVTVKKPTLNKTSLKLSKGKTFTLKITGKVGNARFSSSNKSVATVDSNGKIKGVKKGSSVISVKTNGITLKCSVKVE